MISIKQLMARGDGEVLEAYRNTSILLLESLAQHCVQGEASKLDIFRSTLNELVGKLNESELADEIVSVGTDGSKAIAKYNDGVNRFLKAQSAELQAIIGMLTQTMSAISAGTETSIRRLNEIEQKLVTAAQIDDLRTLKMRMSECLEGLRAESARQQAQSEQMVGGIRTGVDCAVQKNAGISNNPQAAASGLPLRQQAVIEMKRAVAGAKKTFVGIFSVDRIQVINTRFGRTISDDVMLFFLKNLTLALLPADKVFRWTDSSYLAILEREETQDHTRRELARSLSRKWDRIIAVEGRSVVLPVSATWLVIEVSGKPVSESIADIDDFLTRTARRG